MTEKASKATVLGFNPDLRKLEVEFSNPFGGEPQKRSVQPVFLPNGDIDDEASLAIISDLERGVTVKMSLSAQKEKAAPKTQFKILESKKIVEEPVEEKVTTTSPPKPSGPKGKE